MVTATLRFGAFEVQPAAQQVLVDGVPAVLGARAFKLLLTLIERRDRLVTKQELFDTVWDGLVVEEGNLHVQVSNLRRLLGPAAILTIPGRGYRFTPELLGTAPAIGPAAEIIAQGPESAAPAPPAAALGPGNLGAQPPVLMGRDTELQELVARVQAQRLVTLVGAAGMGKTALAQAVAHALRTQWRHGAWWVDLASVSDPALVPQAVAQTLRIARPENGAITDHLVGVLASMSMLLVLDNCEHLVDAAGALGERLLSQTAGVRVLATSQELMNVPGEVLFKLAPLALPPAQALPTEAGAHGAVRLFVERARAVDGRFALSAGNAQAVVDICRRLDGLPLAIELAAARVRLLGVHGLRDKLGERFRVLTGGARTALRRHQTLRAAMDWSHSLLSAAEQAVLRRLGVFVGGFALELAQGVARDDTLDEWAVLDALSGLVDKSLVTAAVTGSGEGTEPPRYSLLETTRAYALEQLAAAGETDACIARHAQVVCAFFERYEEARRGEGATIRRDELVSRTVPELDNERAALAWAAGESGADGSSAAGVAARDLDLAVGLAGAAMLSFGNVSLMSESAAQMMGLRARLEGAPAGVVSPLRAAHFWQSLTILGQSAHVPITLALQAADRAEVFYRAQGLRKRLAYLQVMKTVVLTMAGRWPQAAEAVAAARAAEAPDWSARNIGGRLRSEGWVHLAQGQADRAMQSFERMRVLFQSTAGEQRFVIESEAEICRCLLLLARHDECIALAQAVVAREGAAAVGALHVLLRVLMLAQARSGRRADARDTLLGALPRWRRYGLALSSGDIAAALGELGHAADAVRVGAAAAAYLRRYEIVWTPTLQYSNQRREALLAAAGCAPEDVARWQREGEALDDAAIESICRRALQDASSAS